jgi:hypothetical protein
MYQAVREIKTMRRLLSGSMVAGNVYNVLVKEGVAIEYINGNRNVLNGSWEQMTYIKTEFANQMVTVMFKNEKNAIVSFDSKNHMVSHIAN